MVNVPSILSSRMAAPLVLLRLWAKVLCLKEKPPAPTTPAKKTPPPSALAKLPLIVLLTITKEQPAADVAPGFMAMPPPRLPAELLETVLFWMLTLVPMPQSIPPPLPPHVLFEIVELVTDKLAPDTANNIPPQLFFALLPVIVLLVIVTVPL